ncbi:MAG: hypothetical protein S0880_00630 [Actinomycetota bacterium]|nr:hypothetical protein [Actinomycetota bacterium]
MATTTDRISARRRGKGPAESLADRRPNPAVDELTRDLDDAGAFETSGGAGATGAHLFSANALATRGLLRYVGGSARRLGRRIRG